jgi:hypothetical protein
MVSSQEHLVHGLLPFELILKVLSFKNSSKGCFQELIFGLRVLDDFLRKEEKGVWSHQ